MSLVSMLINVSNNNSNNNNNNVLWIFFSSQCQDMVVGMRF